MKSFKMKALALATLGLGGLVMAGGAFAACPDPTAFSNQGYAQPNGPWSGEFVTNSTIASTAGLAGTSCAMKVAFTPSSGTVLGNSTAFVQDQSPNNEQRYRARFYVSFSGLTSAFSTATATGETVLLMSSVANLGPSGRSPSVVRVYLVGGSPMAIRFLVADSAASNQVKILTAAIPTPGGVNRIEFDYNTYPGATQQSACETGSTNGSFCAWVTDGATASIETAPTVKYNLAGNSFDSNGVSGWTGVKFTNLGIFAPNNTVQGDS
ncbi:MAG: hypothetical protein KGI64_11850, partial [Xanthomonadaceae bacterium]|nr:hypothetical protein [Xanthomonadaceae bacterium]